MLNTLIVHIFYFVKHYEKYPLNVSNEMLNIKGALKCHVPIIFRKIENSETTIIFIIYCDEPFM